MQTYYYLQISTSERCQDYLIMFKLFYCTGFGCTNNFFLFLAHVASTCFTFGLDFSHWLRLMLGSEGVGLHTGHHSQSSRVVAV